MNTYAFPSGHDPKTGTAQFGMNLRDYFAAKAMQSYLYKVIHSYTHEESIVTKTPSLKEITEASYEIADEMMKAREL